MRHKNDRPIVTCNELSVSTPLNPAPKEALLTPAEFLKMVWMISGHKATRRLAQFYSSPKSRLLPLPVYRNRHTAHYLHPEHTVRFAVLLHLREAYFLPLKLVKVVLDGFPADHYDLLLSDVFSARDLVRIAREGLGDAWVRDVLFSRASRAQNAARMLGKAQEDARKPVAVALAETGPKPHFRPVLAPTAAAQPAAI